MKRKPGKYIKTVEGKKNIIFIEREKREFVFHRDKSSLCCVSNIFLLAEKVGTSNFDVVHKRKNYVDEKAKDV